MGICRYVEQCPIAHCQEGKGFPESKNDCRIPTMPDCERGAVFGQLAAPKLQKG